MKSLKMTAIVLALAGCTAQTGSSPAAGPGPGDLGGKADGYWGRSILHKSIDPVEVPAHAAVGAPMADVVAEQLADASVVRDGDFEFGCEVDAYQSEGAFYEHQRCDDPEGLDNEFLRVSTDEATGWDVIYADFDGDGQTDAVLDHAADESIYDDDRDGAVDRVVESIANLEDFVVEGYPEGWNPPRRLAKRILEDTDHDGFFDRESVTGEDFWWCEANADGEWLCDDPGE